MVLEDFTVCKVVYFSVQLQKLKVGTSVIFPHFSPLMIAKDPVSGPRIHLQLQGKDVRSLNSVLPTTLYCISLDKYWQRYTDTFSLHRLYPPDLWAESRAFLFPSLHTFYIWTHYQYLKLKGITLNIKCDLPLRKLWIRPLRTYPTVTSLLLSLDLCAYQCQNIMVLTIPYPSTTLLAMYHYETRLLQSLILLIQFLK